MIKLAKYLIKRYYAYFKYDVKLGKNVTISLNSKFEPNVAIYDGCIVTNSCIGFGTYVASNSKLCNVLIGRYCSIGGNVQTGFGIHPSKKYVSTHPAFFSTKKQSGFTFVQQQTFEEHKFVDRDSKYFVRIGNDVWIGNDVRIVDGVSIGDGAIIGLGSIVTKDVEPYSINVGIPTKKIGYRFEKEQISLLVNLKWWNKDFNWIKSNSHLFCDIDEFIKEPMIGKKNLP